MNEQIELWPLSVRALYEGLYIDFEIYYLKDERFVLLCRNIMLDGEQIGKFIELLGSNSNIYVQKEHQQKILDKGAYFRKVQKKLEDSIGYTFIKSETQGMLRDAFQTGKIKVEAVEAISEDLNQTLNTVPDAVIIQCLNSVREVDEYLYSHSSNVALLNGLLGKWLRLPKPQVDKLIKIGLVHDVGKLRVPQELLNKPDVLTPEEFEAIKPHALFSYDMLKASGEKDIEVLNATLQHHEKINGTGYPLGLSGREISYFARITAVSDVYDAMISRRVYKNPHSPFEILHEFSLGRFSALDIEIVNVFLRNMPSELTGKLVLLSDGSVARVTFVSPGNVRYPIVILDGKVVSTDAQCHCVSMLQEQNP